MHKFNKINRENIVYFHPMYEPLRVYFGSAPVRDSYWKFIKKGNKMKDQLTELLKMKEEKLVKAKDHVKFIESYAMAYWKQFIESREECQSLEETIEHLKYELKELESKEAAKKKDKEDRALLKRLAEVSQKPEPKEESEEDDEDEEDDYE